MESRKFLTVRQAANELGLRERTIRQWIWRRQIEFCKIGGAVRIPATVIDRIIEQGTVPAHDA